MISVLLTDFLELVVDLLVDMPAVTLQIKQIYNVNFL